VTPKTSTAQDTLEQISFTVDHFEVVGDNPIGDRADSVLAPFSGEQYGLEGLSAARDALEQAIIDAGYNFHRVSLPPQELFEGTVAFKVSAFSIGNISVEGNEYFDDENILRSVPVLISGETPNTRELSRSLKLANEHASKSTVLRFKGGEASDSIDAILSVEDRNPQVFFIAIDNTGVTDSDTPFRSTFGYQHGNLFNRDNALTATLTTAPEDPETTTQFGLNYHVPMYRHGGSVDVLFSKSNSAGTTGGDTGGGQAPGTGGGQAADITGKGTVYGFFYNRPMLTDGSFNHEWSLGVQHKVFDNDVRFNNAPISEYEVLSIPLELRYSFKRHAPGSSFFGSLSLLQEIGDDDFLYQLDRPGSESGWTELRYRVSYDILFAKAWLFHIRSIAQFTNSALISGEQFGLGGVGTLRGFEERTVTGDSGYQVTLELWMPPVPDSSLRFSVFIDLGHTEFNASVSGITNQPIPAASFDMSSTGVGMFWSWKESLSVALNYGYILEGGGLDDSINRMATASST
jgi:hemolysin activation/secretion protein